VNIQHSLDFLNQEISELTESAIEYDKYHEYAGQADRLRYSASELVKVVELIKYLNNKGKINE
jgi:hypothetical protein